MDYKKKYKEAFERVKELLSRCRDNRDRRTMVYRVEDIESIFSELKKSEDEKIKEDLIEWISDFPDMIWSGHYKKDVIAWLEKQGEQKTADEVEPKFHKGEWITNGDYTWKIVEVKPLDYILQSQDGNIVDDTISHVDEQFHSFTIQDAKEGDVLYAKGFYGDCVFIFNGLDKWKFDEPSGDRAVATGHCCITISSKNIEFGTQGPDCVEVDTVNPATKEQRDLLFKKMKESGYDFDFETKELKKIDTYCQENCKGFQETGRCFCDGDCKAKKDYIKHKDKQKQDVSIQINPSDYINDMGGNGCYLKNTAQASAWSKKEEKVDNQNCVKSIYDVKPKFKVGDWISNDMCDVHIASIENGMYYFDEGDGLSIVFVDEHYHIWTIQDAKDGDVLVTVYDKRPLIYKGCLDPNHPDSPVAYCGIDSEGYFICSCVDKFNHWWTDEKVQPATKEQRDLLFQKMIEDGYEWDEKKKELKKIKMLPTEWSEEEELSCFESALFTAFSDAWQSYLLGEEVNVKQWAKEQSKELLEAAKEELKGHNSAWSEEDETYLDLINTAIKLYYTDDKGKENPWRNELLRWLKSLKDRIQPHKQWKPNEEQIKAFEHFVRSIGESGYASLYENNTKLLYSLLEQLKKL